MMQASNELKRGVVTFHGDEFFKVLSEFSTELNRLHPEVESHAERGGVPNAFYLKIAPKLRRYEGSITLSCWLTTEGLKCGTDLFAEVNEFESYLVEFYKNPTFQQSLQILSEQSRSDVRGLLRISPAMVQVQDEIFRLDSKEFGKLVEAPVGESVTIRAEREPSFNGKPRPPSLSKLQKFLYFGVNGYGMEMSKLESVGGNWYLLTGVVQPVGTIR